MRVFLLSHAFHDPENRKNLVELGRQIEIVAATPARWDLPPEDRDFKLNDFSASDAAREHFMPLRMVRLTPGSRVTHYALGSLSFGFRQSPPDVIHVDYDPWSPIFWQATAARRMFAPRAPIVVSPKKNTYRSHPGLTGKAKPAIARRGLGLTSLLMPASEMAGRMYEENFEWRGPTRVVTHVAVDTDAFAPAGESGAESGPLTVGFSGRFADQKGVGDLVEAVAQLASRTEDGPAVELRLLGSGPLGPELEARAAREPWLEVLSPVPVGEVAGFMRGIDLFVLPTRVEPDHEEHDAHALLQALASGVPAIGTRSGIIPEVIGDGTGVLVGAEDPAGLAGAIATLAGDPGERRRLAEAGRRRAESEFSLGAVAKARVAAYREAIEVSL